MSTMKIHTLYNCLLRLATIDFHLFSTMSTSPAMWNLWPWLWLLATVVLAGQLSMSSESFLNPERRLTRWKALQRNGTIPV